MRSWESAGQAEQLVAESAAWTSFDRSGGFSGPCVKFPAPRDEIRRHLSMRLHIRAWIGAPVWRWCLNQEIWKKTWRFLG